LLVPAVEQHQRQFGRAPRMVAADTGFYSLKNEKTIQGMGVTRVAVPSRSSKSMRSETAADLNEVVGHNGPEVVPATTRDANGRAAEIKRACRIRRSLQTNSSFRASYFATESS